MTDSKQTNTGTPEQVEEIRQQIIMESLEKEQNFLSTGLLLEPKIFLTLTFTLCVLICIYIERGAKEAPNKIITNLL